MKCPPREMIYGKEECKSHQFTIFLKIFSWFYLNLWYERQFRGTLYNVGQLGIYGNLQGMVKNCTVLYPVDSLGAEGTKCICP